MKIVKKYILPIIISQVISFSSFAGDQYYNFLSGSQKAVVIGKITKKNGSNIFINVEKTISGEETPKKIKIDLKSDSINSDHVSLKENDFIVASVDRSNSIKNFYTVKWGIYKVDSLDYKKTKIIEPNYNLADNFSLSWFINSGAKKYDGIHIYKNLEEYNSRVLWYTINQSLYKNNSLILGKIEGFNIYNKILYLDVKKVFYGSAKQDSIVKVNLDYFDFMQSLFYRPKKDDFLLLNVDDTDPKNKVYTLPREEHLFQVSSLDYKSLKVINSKFNKQKEYIKALEWYIHSDGKEKDFYLPDGKLFLKDSNGSFIQIQDNMEIKKEKFSEILASKLHDVWRKPRKKADGTYNIKIKITKDPEWIKLHNNINEIDIANTNYEDLPSDWKKENLASAIIATNIIYDAIKNKTKIDEVFIENASSIIHDEWLKRNTWSKGGELDVPYSKLPEIEKAKDREIIKLAEK
jgi:hypothetical protein